MPSVMDAEADMKVERITKDETRAFGNVLEKLVGMSGRSRRSNICWKTMRTTLEHLGNWKNAARGKPGKFTE